MFDIISKIFQLRYLKELILGLIISIASPFILNSFKEVKSLFFPDQLSIQGIWDGAFYENGEEILSVLRIQMKENSLQFEGAMIENRGTLKEPKKTNSNIQGDIKNHHIEFKKIYTAPQFSTDKLIYSGNIDKIGKIIEGTWQSKSASGKFKFRKIE